MNNRRCPLRPSVLPPALLAGVLLLGACALTPQRPDPGHLAAPQTAQQDIPAPVQSAPRLELPRPAAPLETYSVVVTEVPVKEMLFALARDAKLNVDIHPGVGGTVTLNALDQTLPQLLDRIARQTDVRFSQDGDTLHVEPDQPFLRSYAVDYVNMARNNTSSVSVATQIATTGQAAGGDAGGGGAGNNSTTEVASTSNHQFWGTLERNLRAILGEVVTAGASEGSATVIVNAESGVLTVRATDREHRQIQAFIDQVLASAQRQVMIEATVVEVRLNDQYQLGVDWSLIANGAGWSVNQALLGANLSEEPLTLLTYADPDTRRGDATANIGLLRQFGDVKVLSSPRIMAINNQTALLKVVDNLVYFTIEADTTTTDSVASTTYTTTVHTVPVGFVMSVTPQINDTDTVILNIRPTISRVTSFVNDPNPALIAPSGRRTESSVPQIQVREMDSLLRINSGQTAVLGGLIQDGVDLNRSGTPVLSELPVIGDAFSYRDNRVHRTELVIFLRPRVIREASVGGELADYQRYLPARQRLSAEPERLTGRRAGDGS
ncbi:MAG: pilus (MSHA type) biogenesis protein MshL [Gammaproteobacteria bacterium]